MENELNNGPINVEQDAEKRKGNVDRSQHKYSEDDFRNLSRHEQFSLASKHWMDSKGFDDSQMFQFSYTKFSTLCKDLGFEKGVLDTKKDEIVTSKNKAASCIFIEHGKRAETEVKKITLSKCTISKMEQLLDGLSNIEKSKVLDVLFEKLLDEKLQDKEAGRFGVFYNPQKGRRIL